MRPELGGDIAGKIYYTRYQNNIILYWWNNSQFFFTNWLFQIKGKPYMVMAWLAEYSTLQHFPNKRQKMIQN